MLLAFVLLWLAFGVGVGAFASSRGRDFTIWCVVGLVISPLIAIVILAATPEVNHEVEASPVTVQAATSSELLARFEQLFDRGAATPVDHARIKVLAARELPARPPAADPKKAPPSELTRPCPKCGGLVHSQATTCMHCWTKLAKIAA
ncbi:MAG: hypothetical protein JO257_17060 [Deltaproteobacteria bacterium]|nr:hypothetical protein [Deltaproteobacteria bacterium]